MITLNKPDHTYLIDLKNYRRHARRIERQKLMEELLSEALFVLGFILVVVALGYFLPVVLPLR